MASTSTDLTKLLDERDGVLSTSDILRFMSQGQFRLPEPTRQSARRDSKGRRRWTDVTWDNYKIVVEIDGAQHTADPLQRWDDMERDIHLSLDGYQTLRFPAWLIRANPEYVARKILEVPRRAGDRG